MIRWHVDGQRARLILEVFVLDLRCHTSAIVVICKHDTFFVFKLLQLGPEVLRVKLCMIQLEPLELKLIAFHRLCVLCHFLNFLSVLDSLRNGRVHA